MSVDNCHQHQNWLLDYLARIRAYDHLTYIHSVNVSLLSYAISDVIGLEKKEIDQIWKGALLHDLGKISIPPAILNKPSSPTPEEWKIIKQHPLEGLRILTESVPTAVREGSMHHHERWDGQGYPWGLAGENIPLVARIIAIADTLDAVTARRPYRQASLTYRRALKEIICVGEGRHFDPYIVDKLKSDQFLSFLEGLK